MASIQLTDEQQELVKKNINLVYFVAGKYSHIPREAYEDLTSKLYGRLCKSIASWDPNKGVKISSYLVKSLEGEAKNYFRDDVWVIRPPRTIREKALANNEDEEGEDEADRIRSCVSPISLDVSLSGSYGEFQLELPDGEELLEDQIVNRIGGTAIVKSVFSALRPEESFILGCQMSDGGLQKVQEHFGIPPNIAKEVWEELRQKVEVLYKRASEDLPLEESTGNEALTRALMARFAPPRETFVEVKERLANEKHSPA